MGFVCVVTNVTLLTFRTNIFNIFFENDKKIKRSKNDLPQKKIPEGYPQGLNTQNNPAKLDLALSDSDI